MTTKAEQPLSASQKFEEEAKIWEETRKLQWCGHNQYAFVQLHCWLLSDGAEVDGVSKRLKRYYSATKRISEEEEGGTGWMISSASGTIAAGAVKATAWKT